MFPVILIAALVGLVLFMPTKVWGYVDGKPVSLDLVPIRDGKYLERKAATAFLAMDAEARRALVYLEVNSAFRTMTEQVFLYEKYLNGDGAQAAKPGTSNHQAGRSVDIAVQNSRSSPTYLWLATNARRFGFVNDVSAEPWHWTYIGA